MYVMKMAKNSDCKGKIKSGIKVEGDIGDLQIITEINDEDDSSNDEQTEPSSYNSTMLETSLGKVVQASTLPVYGSVSVSDSENVQFGNNTYFNGPVTIIQNKSGFENTAYSREQDDDKQNEECRTKPKLETAINERKILTWHKLTFTALCVVIVGGICAIILILRTKTEDHSPTSTYSQTDNSANMTVVVSNSEKYLIIIVSAIMLPITLLLMYCYFLLLTKMASVLDDMKHYNSVKKEVTRCEMCMHDISKENQLLIAPNHLRIVSRTDWLAQPAAGELDKLVQPVPWVIITHTATESCHTQSKCVLRVRLIQSFHIESRGWYDIGYNFLVGGDGSVYYGRGWDYMGAHTKGYNKYSIAIAFIGTFNIDPPSKQQVDACKKIIQQGVDSGKLIKDYKLFAHRQLISTLSPGDKVYDIIKEWPHFVHNFTDVDSLVPQDY